MMVLYCYFADRLTFTNEPQNLKSAASNALRSSLFRIKYRMLGLDLNYQIEVLYSHNNLIVT